MTQSSNIGSRKGYTPPRTGQPDSRPLPSGGSTFGSRSVLNGIDTLLGSGQLGTKVETTLASEKRRLETRSGRAPELSQRAAHTVHTRLREIDVVLRASVLQPSMERQLQTERNLLQNFAKYCSAK